MSTVVFDIMVDEHPLRQSVCSCASIPSCQVFLFVLLTPPECQCSFIPAVCLSGSVRKSVPSCQNCEDGGIQWNVSVGGRPVSFTCMKAKRLKGCDEPASLPGSVPLGGRQDRDLLPTHLQALSAPLQHNSLFPLFFSILQAAAFSVLGEQSRFLCVCVCVCVYGEAHTASPHTASPLKAERDWWELWASLGD